MIKPFNPPRKTNTTQRKSGGSGQKNNGDKQRSVTCKPLPNPRNVKNLIKNTIIGDSLYSEDENSENMDSFESSESIYKKDKSEDDSRHSSDANNRKRKRRVNRITDTKNRKHLFSSKKDNTY
jgi:hypothetical protein